MEFTQSIIAHCRIERNDVVNIPQCVQEQANNFALLKVKTRKVEMTNSPTFLLFSIDKTGSMGEYGGNFGSKLDYVKHTFKNMIRYLANIVDAEIYIRVHAFDENVVVLIDTVRVTPNNVGDLINKIESLASESMTAIDEALQKAKNTMAEYSASYPTHQIGHIFMTDGEASKGETSDTVLAEMVNENFANIFVGFGSGHNVSLLHKLSDKKKADYQYVDSPESTVLIYGETIHQFLYPAIKNVRISARNALIYNWKTNEWVTEIQEDVIIGETEKVYHVKEADDSLYDAEVDVVGQDASTNVPTSVLLATGYSMPGLTNLETNETLCNDFTNYIFRQKVLELLYKVKEDKMSHNEKKNLKKELKAFFREMRFYMKESDKLNDPLMKNLCDDISIVYHTLGKRDGMMFTLARQSTHGNQKAYTPTSSRTQTEEIYRVNAMDEFDSQEPMTPRTRIAPMMRTNSSGLSLAPLSLAPLSLAQLSMTHLSMVPISNAQRSMAPLSIPPPFPDISEENDDEEFEESVTQPVVYASDEDIETYNATAVTQSCYAAPPVLNTIRTMSQQ